MPKKRCHVAIEAVRGRLSSAAEEFQFKKGRSGNPTGKRKTPPISPDLKAQLERELNKPVTIRSGKQRK